MLSPSDRGNGALSAPSGKPWAATRTGFPNRARRFTVHRLAESNRTRNAGGSAAPGVRRLGWYKSPQLAARGARVTAHGSAAVAPASGSRRVNGLRADRLGVVYRFINRRPVVLVPVVVVLAFSPEVVGSSVAYGVLGLWLLGYFRARPSGPGGIADSNGGSDADASGAGAVESGSGRAVAVQRADSDSDRVGDLLARVERDPYAWGVGRREAV